MGTKVQSKTCLLPGYHSMRDLNEDSSNYGRHLFCDDKSFTNGQYYNGYSPRATTDTMTWCDKDIVKQTMLEHEAIFKKQVYELHRLYQIQRDLMEETRRKEIHRNQYIEGTSFCPRPSTSQITIDDSQRLHVPGIFTDSFSARFLLPGVKTTHSPPDAVKEDSRQDGAYTPPNRSSQRDFKVLESRPTKVRRKIFDLQLPANVYADSDESDKFSDEKGSGSSARIVDRNCKIGPQVSLMLLHRDGEKESSQEDNSRSEQSIRNNGLADLNQPAGMEETNASSSTYSFGQSSHPMTNGFPILPVTTKSQFLSSSKENLFTALRENGHELQNNQYLGKSGNGKKWISHVSEAGHGKSNLQSTCHGSQPERLFSSPQTMHKVNDSSYAYRADLSVSDIEISKNCHGTSTNKHLDSLCSLRNPSTLPVDPFSNVAGSWSHSVTSYDMPSSSYNQKSMSTQMYSCLNSSAVLSMNVPLPGHTNVVIEEPGPSNSNSTSNLQNGFYHGYPFTSKEVLEQAVNLDSCGYGKSSNFDDLKLVKDLSMGFLLSKYSSNKLVTEQSPAFVVTERKQKAPLAALPWLQTRASCKNDEPVDCKVSTGGVLSYVQTSSGSKKHDTKWGLSATITHNITSVSCSSNFEGRRTIIGGSSCNKKIFGVPIFEKPYTSKNNSSSLTSPVSAPKPSEDEVVENKRKIRILDINLPCDLAVANFGDQIQGENLVEGVNSVTKDVKFGSQFDLNLSVTDEEAYAELTQSSKLKMTSVIDLETPAFCEMKDDTNPASKKVETPLASPQSAQQDAKQTRDEHMMKAAEAIVAISSVVCSNESDDVVDMARYQSEISINESLAWFVDIVSSCFDNLEEMLDTSLRGKHNQCNEDSSSEGIDVFESMTLRQAETKEEDYMPQPLVPANFKLEESGPSLLPTRPRRGPARRGRQRRDFQRDILPSLASLSRHEVTEDLQTFGGLMRAMGHSWNLGLTRRSSTRSGSGRGRRRMAASPSPPPAANAPSTPLIQQINNVEVGEEERNLTVWGKTPRRPRRQRCAATGNQLIPLT